MEQVTENQEDNQANGLITKDKLMARIRDGEIDTLVIAFCDMQGRLMGKRVTGAFCLENDMDEGTHFCNYLLGTDFEMNVPDGYDFVNWENGYGDWQARPDWATLRVVPWQDKTAMVFADVYDDKGEQVIPIAPRNLLKHQIERAVERGFQPFMASELEFYFFQDSFQQVHQKGYENMDVAGRHNEDYNLLQGSNNEPFYHKVRQYMGEAGIMVESSKGEAHIGQHEVNMKFDDALTAADNHILFKHGIKELCMQNDCAVTFMAKPYQDWTGSSGHVHLSISDPYEGKNLFYQDKENPMSPVMQQFLAGVLAHTRDFSLFFAPYVNSYKRFAPNSWAPVNVVWSHDNRSAGYRIVGEGSNLRFETRIPGADMNPYLAYAALIGAGLYGVEQQLELPKGLEGNAYKDQEVPKIPSSLHEAIACWENSDVVKKVLGEEVANHYLYTAKLEQQNFDSIVTNWERTRYFEQC